MKRLQRVVCCVFVLILLTACGTAPISDVIFDSPKTIDEWIMQQVGFELDDSKSSEDTLMAADTLKKTLKRNIYGVYRWGDGGAKQHAAGIEVLYTAHSIKPDKGYLQSAQRAAMALTEPQEKGGLLYLSNDEVWLGDKNEAGQWCYYPETQLLCIRVLGLLPELPSELIELHEKLVGFAPEMLLRFNQKNSFAEVLEPIDHLDFFYENPYKRELLLPTFTEIKLIDEVSGNENKASHEVALMTEVASEVLQVKVPGTFDVTRTQPFLLEMAYSDTEFANVTVKLQGKQENSTRNLRDGDLLVDGSGAKRNWRVSIRIPELYEPADKDQAFVIRELLKELQVTYPALRGWAETAATYYNFNYNSDAPTIIEQTPVQYPDQTWPNGAQIDENGVVFQRDANSQTRMTETGEWDRISHPGDIGYNLYLIAQQAMNALAGLELAYLPDYDGYKWVHEGTKQYITKEAALSWIKTEWNPLLDGAVWLYTKDNAYSDLVQKAPWQSAYGQRYIMQALQYHNENELLLKAALAYQYPTQEGGLNSPYWKESSIWYEEVPNNSHILNGHLTSLIGLAEANEVLNDDRLDTLYEQGVNSLIEHIADYDNGYWTSYDANPQKDNLFQIDWLEGEKSPLIESIELLDPRDNTATHIAVEDFNTYPYCSGTDWISSESANEKTVRGFRNGYLYNNEPLDGGTRQNVYFVAAMPNREFKEYFDVPTFYLDINYKDVAPGKFSINMRSRNQGNHLEFVPLRDGIIECTGDGQWKTARIAIDGKYFDSYMGYEYHQFHAEQVRLLAEREDNWYLAQYADKWESYLKRWQNELPPVIENGGFAKIENVTPLAVVKNSMAVVKGFGVENSLDGDPNDDYTAAETRVLPQSFTIAFTQPVAVYGINLTFENAENFATEYLVEGKDAQGNTIWSSEQKDRNGKEQFVLINKEQAVEQIAFTVTATSGQQRILLRQIQIFGERGEK